MTSPVQNSFNFNPDIVLTEMLSVHHGWWCDEIIEKRFKGRIRYSLKKNPYYSPSFLRLYGYSKEDISLDNVVSEAYQPVVIDEMKKAMQPGFTGTTGTIIAKTASGTEKLVEVYVRRIELENCVLLASLHSDLTVATDQQWIDRTVLRSLQAFVFVKKWDEDSKRFVFTYMNPKLSEILGVNPSTQVQGMADADFFYDDAQQRGFHEADETVANSESDDLVLVREETISPHSPNTGEPLGHFRLLTFKTPYWPPSNGQRTGPWEVLGVAVDVTSVTDVLRAVADKSDDALYIKDSRLRYQYVNKRFLELIGAESDLQVLNRTFPDALQSLGELGLIGSPNRHKDLESMVAKEDRRVLSGEPTRSIRTALLNPGPEWLSAKQPIRDQSGRVSHILGVTSELFPGRLGDLLDKIPQCLAVKKYCEPEYSTDGQFKYVWANKSFLNLHGLRSASEIIGKTDFDFWSESQANEYRLKDQQVVNLFFELAAAPGWNSLSKDERWRRLSEALRKSECWEYREGQRSGRTSRMLQTTKWAESIEGAETIFVVVVYSDLTRGTPEQRRYQEMTAHNIKGAVAPVAVASEHLTAALQSETISEEAIMEALECLNDASENVALITAHHMDLLRMNISCSPVRVADLVAIAEREASKCSRLWDGEFKVDYGADHKKMLTLCDKAFVQFVIAEFFLNAAKAVDRRIAKTQHRSLIEEVKEDYFGQVTVSFMCRDGTLRVEFCDNGIACVSENERKKLYAAVEEADSNPFQPYLVSLGLPFCFVAIKEQQGDIEVKSETSGTTFVVSLPIME